MYVIKVDTLRIPFIHQCAQHIPFLGATYSNVNLTVTDFVDTNREIPASTLANPGRYIHIKISTTVMADHWYEIVLGYTWVAPASADNVIFVRRRDGSSYTAWKQVTTTLVS